MPSESLYIVIPAYNESANIQGVIDDWYPIVEQYSGEGKSRLLIVDDGSKDNTYELLKEAALTRPLLEVVTKPNGGHGDTVLFGYQHALKNGADYIFQTDSDGQTLPGEFSAFWQEKDSHDMVIGWRKGRMDGLSRIFVTKTLKLVIRLCFGVWVTDANTPFRLLKASTLQKYIGLIPPGYNLSNVLLSVIYVKENMGVKFIPITFRPRQGGVNSINLKKIFGIGWKALHDFRLISKSIK